MQYRTCAQSNAQSSETILAFPSPISRLAAQSSGGAVATVAQVGLPARVANALVSYVVYLRQAFVPTGLAVFYPYPEAVSIGAALGALAVLAAITIPRFKSATLESHEATILSNLQRVRQAIERYWIEHDETFPTVDIVAQLYQQTNVDGSPGTAKGPYLRGEFPMNPLKGRNDIQVLNTMYHEAYGLQGWMYAQQTGEIRLNSPGVGPSGVAYFEM